MGRKMLFLVIIAISVCNALSASPVTVTQKQQEDALNVLRKALADKPASAKNGAELKAVLTKWINDTDENVLRNLVSRMQYPVPSRPVINKTKIPPAKLRHVGQQYPSYEDSIPPQIILKRLLALGEPGSEDQLKVFLNAMNTPEGKKAITKLNIKQEVIDQLLKEMNGNAEQQAKAKNSFKVLLQSITKKEQSKLRDVYKAYLLYALRAKASETIQKATPEQISSLLNVLAKAEKRIQFKNINFASLESQGKTDTGRTKAVETIYKWIAESDIKNLRRVVHYATVTEQPVKTLEQVKLVISKKIDQKSPAQLAEFLEVLETTEGKALLNKLSVKPTTSTQDLLKKLKSGNKDEETSVKKSLQEWINKMTIKDMKELQNSRQLFIHYRARKTAVEGIQKADEKTLLSILTFLSKKESSGVKFDGIKFTDLRTKLEKDGAKSVEETKKTLLDWISKIKFEQLSALNGAQPVHIPPGSRRVGSVATTTTARTTIKPTTNTTTPAASRIRPAANTTTPAVTTAKPATNTTTPRPAVTTTRPAGNTTTATTIKLSANSTTPAVTTTTINSAPKLASAKKPSIASKVSPVKVHKTAEEQPITSLAQIRTAALFNRFLLNKNSKVSVTSASVKTVLAQLITHGTNDDIKTIFAITTKGLSGHVVKLLQEGLFKVQMVKTNDLIKTVSTDKNWVTLRKDLNKWVGNWNKNQSSLFVVWYKRGAEGKKK